MVAMRVNAPEWELGLSWTGQAVAVSTLVPVSRRLSRHSGFPARVLNYNGFFYSSAGLRSSIRGCMACAEENTVIFTTVDCLYIDTPEVLDGAWPSTSSETGKPKVMGWYPLPVSSDLISKSRAQGNNAKCGRSLAGVSDSEVYV